MTRNISVGAAILTVAFVAIVWWLTADNTPSKTKESQSQPRAPITSAVAERRDLTPVLDAYGMVAADPSTVTTIAAPRDIKVERVLVRPGDPIKAGTPLITISTQPGALVQIRQAESGLKLAQEEAGRLRRLRAAGLAGNDQVANAEKNLADAKAQLAALQAVGSDHANSDLVAPRAGIVLAIAAGEGNVAVTGASLLTIATERALLVTAGLEPEDAVRTIAGLKARLQSPLDRSLNIDAVVLSVGRAVDPVSRLVNATLRAERVESLIPGMVLSVRIELPAQGGVVVPRSAILEDAEGLHVFAIANDVASRRPVELAFETDTEALVKSGLAPGEKVAIAGVAVLHDGTGVRESRP